MIFPTELSKTEMCKLSSPILDHTNLGEEAKISKKFAIVIHRKLNCGCTRRVGNLIIICQLDILGVPRLLQAQICSIFTICVYFIT